METLLHAINLLPDFAIIAAMVVISHWVWLFGLKKNFAPTFWPVPSKKSHSEITPASKERTVVENVHHISPSSTTELYTSTKIEDLAAVMEEQETDNSPPPARETMLIEKYAALDMIPILESLQQGDLPPERQKELQELAFLTMSTEEKYPNPLDLN